jgi:MYXO-CTERM domain-containing protein
MASPKERVMKRSKFLVLVPPAMALLCASSATRADQAADAFNAWSAAFLVQSNGQTFYSANPISEAPVNRPAGWIDGLVIEMVEDVYQRNHTDAHRQLINDLVTSYLANAGTDWSGDPWNDDLGWMMTAVLHAYQITGNNEFLTVATNTWNLAYNRGWDSKYADGGIWENMAAVTPNFSNPTKCALSNNPIVIQGTLLYQLTGDQTYLTKSEAIYAWVRNKLFDGTTGEVHGCWDITSATDTGGHLDQHDDNAYNDGTFIEAAEGLYRMTGDMSYYQDALKAITHRVTQDAILHSNQEGQQSEWAYPFVKGLSQFATFNGLWHNYQTWMENNAAAAWSKRNTLNITWNDWTAATPSPAFVPDPANDVITSLDTRGATGIWQLLPQPLIPALVGTFELQTVNSGLSLTTAPNGTSVVQEPFENSLEWLWTFVPADGGYYRIQELSTGQYLSVDSNSARPGAAIVVSPMPTFAQGNDQWLPSDNGDGTYTFYNLSSILALDDPGASKLAGTAFAQWVGNGTDGQKFRLIPHAYTLPEDAGVGEVDASLSADAGERSSPPAASSGCSCSTTGVASSANRGFGGLTFVALGALGALRRRRQR